ncbi:MAG TPA: FAD:protein FMN transferase [Gaiellaceae bacterium]|nr:FAD:protein FMN transferase [Gaiellaceae bacterium]
MEQTGFRAMGTEVELILDVPPNGWSPGIFATVRQEFARLESILSRFRPDSELSALNRSGRVHAGPDLVRVTELALAARVQTNGRFDPTVHDALVAAGYDRTFEEVGALGTVVATRPDARCGGGVSVDRETGEIVLEPGTHLDFGGIGKGYAVDRACDLLAPYGPCLVSAGGDLAVRGGSWPVGVDAALELTLELTSGAIATSGSDRRRWSTTRGDAHHLIDPQTGAPSETDLVRVTVVGRSAVEAEVLAKALFLAGVERARAEADELEVPAVLTLDDGRILLAGGLS